MLACIKSWNTHITCVWPKRSQKQPQSMHVETNIQHFRTDYANNPTFNGTPSRVPRVSELDNRPDSPQNRVQRTGDMDQPDTITLPMEAIWMVKYRLNLHFHEVFFMERSRDGGRETEVVINGHSTWQIGCTLNVQLWSFVAQKPSCEGCLSIG